MAEQNLTLQQVTTMFQEMMQTLVTEMRKPPHDPIKEAQKKREQDTKVKALKEYWEKKAAKKRNCAHSRQDGTCVIAWATQSDNVTRGYCPNCDSTFTPEDGEIYRDQLRRPKGIQEHVRVVA
jgi:hypothetical protein